MFRTTTHTTLFDHAAELKSMNLIEDTSGADARSPARALPTLTSISAAAPGARLG